jgi:hypothetical protein
MVKNAGQEAVEFILITVLVFFAGLMGYFLLGEKLADYFMTDAASAQVANSKLNTINPATTPKYSPDYQTYVEGYEANPYDIPTITTESGITNVSYGDISINIPADTQTSIITTGVSGTTDEITTALIQAVKKLEAMAAADPDNMELQSLKDMGFELADKGHLIADAEEWIELAAKSKTTNAELYKPADNMIEEGGAYHDMYSKYSNNRITDDYYLQNNQTWLIGTLTTNTTEFSNLHTDLQTLASNQSDDVKNITDLIHVLSGEIIEISDNVKTTAKGSVSDLDYLNKQVASKTTDLKSAIIAAAAKKFSKKSISQDNDDPEATNSI